MGLMLTGEIKYAETLAWARAAGHADLLATCPRADWITTWLGDKIAHDKTLPYGPLMSALSLSFSDPDAETLLTGIDSSRLIRQRIGSDPRVPLKDDRYFLGEGARLSQLFLESIDQGLAARGCLISALRIFVSHPLILSGHILSNVSLGLVIVRNAASRAPWSRLEGERVKILEEWAEQYRAVAHNTFATRTPS